jgi:hypothetical protein
VTCKTVAAIALSGAVAAGILILEFMQGVK